MSVYEMVEDQAEGPIATPSQSIEAINRIMSVLFTYKRPAMYKDIALATNLHKITTSQALSASRDMGLTKSGGKRGVYVTTSAGQEYGRLLTAGKENEAKKYLGKILKKQPAYKEIIVFLEAIKGEARDPMDIIIDIERKLNKSWSGTARSRYRDSLTSILTYAGFIRKEGDKIFSLIEQETEETSKLSDSDEKDFVASEKFELLQSNDFRFEVKADSSVLKFAKSQFLAWIDFLEEKIKQEETANDKES
jgi:hypothetical protein